jgi:hypothetical protein
MQTIKPVSRKHTAADEGLSVVYEPLRSINLDPGNPRVHTDKQVQQIARSIEQFGFVVPILVDRNLVVIAGHGRVLAARLLGRKSIPVIRLEHLSDSQRRALLIADNRLAEKAKWNEHLLGEQLKILAESDLDFDLETTGFEMGEIDLFIENLDAQSGESRDDADVLPEGSNDPPVTQAGDCWLLGRHRVLCGNALNRSEYQKLMVGKKAAAVFSDPPTRSRSHQLPPTRVRYGRHMRNDADQAKTMRWSQLVLSHRKPGFGISLAVDREYEEERIDSVRDLSSKGSVATRTGVRFTRVSLSIAQRAQNRPLL